MKSIYEKIKKLRLAKGYTQKFVAEMLDMKQVNYGRLENGQTQLTIEKLTLISGLYKCSICDLIDWDGEGDFSPPLNKYQSQLEKLNNQISSCMEDIIKLKQENIFLKESLEDKKQIIEFMKRNNNIF